jgi:starch phosphorylase
MSEPIRISHPKQPLLSTDVEGFDSLSGLALDMRWSRWTDSDGEQHVFEAQVYLDDLDPEAVRVELCANSADGSGPERVEMQRVRQLVGATHGYAYRAEVPAARPATSYTARLIPQRNGVAVPLEDAHILWRR